MLQGELKLKDFEIKKEAKGVDTAVIINITSVPVTDKSLEIRFHWAGKGTTAAPKEEYMVLLYPPSLWSLVSNVVGSVLCSLSLSLSLSHTHTLTQSLTHTHLHFRY
jgi:hypothetical protein